MSVQGRALGGAIGLVLVIALLVLGLESSAAPSGAAPPPTNAGLATQLPTSVRPPTHVTPSPTHAASKTTAAPQGATYLSTGWGIDISWPQCDVVGALRVTPGFVVVGLTDGRPFTANPCAPAEAAYAHSRTGYSAYLNIDAPRVGSAAGYGRRVALDGLARLAAAKLTAPTIWLDVETLNHWADPVTNVTVINAALRTIQAAGLTAGIYSSRPMWQQITGGASVNVPVWLAMSITDPRQLGPGCRQGFGGRPAVMAQYVATDGQHLVDVDVLCARSLPRSVQMFSPGRR